jgi:hypothetical protein
MQINISIVLAPLILILHPPLQSTINSSNSNQMVKQILQYAQ